MRAVNLVPTDARRSGGGPSLGKLGAAHFLIGLMVIALAAVTAYVLTNNTLSQRKSQLASLQQQVNDVQAQVARLNAYQQFEKLAEARAATVRQIASTRFDWHAALTDLSKVVPSNTSLQSLVATVAPGSGSAGSGGGVRGDIAAPALELKGCTATQDDVARLMSRLRLVNGVTRVTLEDSAKPGGGGAVAASAPSGSNGQACAANGPTFDMVVFFQPVAASLGAGSAQAPTTTPGGSK